MDNITSCEAHFINLRDLIREQNISLKHIPYLGNDSDIFRSLDVIGYVKLIVYAVIMTVGLFGNLTVILTVAFIKSVRNAINFYVTNLAIADAMICVLCMIPHALTLYTLNRFVLGVFMCKITTFTQITCLTCSVLTLCAISCDRFMAVFRPLQSRTTEKHTSVIIAVIWIASIAVSSPLLLVKNHVVTEWANFTEAYCSEDWPVYHYRNEITNMCEKRQYMREIYYIIISFTLFFIPVLIMFGTYIAILYKLWTSKIPGEENEANMKAQSRSKKKVLKMVIVVLVVFVICWTPVQINIIVAAFRKTLGEMNYLPYWYTEFEWFAYFIAYSNSFMNPFIYGQYNKDFRNGLCLIFCCRRKKRRIKRFWGENFFTKSVRSISTTLSTLRSTTQAYISRKISRNDDLDLPETPV